jgi:hypothetical protein
MSLIQLGACYLVIIYTFLESIWTPLVVIISLRYFISVIKNLHFFKLIWSFVSLKCFKTF